jgi:hypothetical protein
VRIELIDDENGLLGVEAIPFRPSQEHRLWQPSFRRHAIDRHQAAVKLWLAAVVDAMDGC